MCSQPALWGGLRFGQAGRRDVPVRVGASRYRPDARLPTRSPPTMAVPGPGYSITMRIAAAPSATAAGDLTMTVGLAGGVITAFDVVESTADQMIVDLSCNALSADHAGDITTAVNSLDGVDVRN